jgi:hypothetical protein
MVAGGNEGVNELRSGRGGNGGESQVRAEHCARSARLTYGKLPAAGTRVVPCCFAIYVCLLSVAGRLTSAILCVMLSSFFR